MRRSMLRGLLLIVNRAIDEVERGIAFDRRR
jgi:hypothetical protein